MMHRYAVASVLGVLLLAAAPTRADDSEDRPGKSGFLVGFSFGFGSTFPCEVCPSAAGELQIGAMAAPRVAVVADIGVVGGEDGRGDSGSLAVGALAVQLWPAERLWLRLGVGIGSTFGIDDEWDDDWDPDVHRNTRSWAATGAAGFEILQKGVFTMDLQVRGAFIRHNQSVAVGIGFNWY
jgi:hypothetical protein